MSVGEHEYASKGVAGSGLGLGIAGTALGVLNSGLGQGLLGGLFGGVNRQDITYDTRVISSLESENAKLKSERYTDQVGIELYKQTVADNKAQTAALNNGINSLYSFAADIDKRFAVAEAINSERINCLSCRVKELESLTKRIVPYTSICPTPMPQYNSWTAPTTETAAGA